MRLVDFVDEANLVELSKRLVMGQESEVGGHYYWCMIMIQREEMAKKWKAERWRYTPVSLISVIRYEHNGLLNTVVNVLILTRKAFERIRLWNYGLRVDNYNGRERLGPCSSEREEPLSIARLNVDKVEFSCMRTAHIDLRIETYPLFFVYYALDRDENVTGSAKTEFLTLHMPYQAKLGGRSKTLNIVSSFALSGLLMKRSIED
ncbi:hypothetical protein L218DRAFT_946088 [Marasmius fiardii PR-910]|nr:hypothetical protein L218DRAFT_946088 [Marasmius fiardii PR-910]